MKFNPIFFYWTFLNFLFLLYHFMQVIFTEFWHLSTPSNLASILSSSKVTRSTTIQN